MSPSDSHGGLKPVRGPSRKVSRPSCIAGGKQQLDGKRGATAGKRTDQADRHATSHEEEEEEETFMLLRSESPAVPSHGEMSSTATGQTSRNTPVRADSQNQELKVLLRCFESR